jgi:hypothetical protein
MRAEDGGVPQLDQEESSDERVKEGWLWKKHQKAHLWTGWHKRYFVLTRTDLLYYKNPTSTRFNGKARLGWDSDIEFKGKKDATAHRRELYQFTVQCPEAQSGPTMFLLGCEKKEDSHLWVSALKSVSSSSRHDSTVNFLSDDGDSEDDEVDGGSTGTPRRNGSFEIADGRIPPIGRKSVPGRQPGIIKESFLYRRNRHPPLIPKAPFYALGWNKRLFTLDWTGRLDWYKIDFKSKTAGDRKGIGSLLLGGDCRVEFPGKPRRTNKQQNFFPFTIFAGRNKLELGGGTFEEALEWVSVLDQCIKRTKHDGSAAGLPTSGGSRNTSDEDEGSIPRLGRSSSVLVESDVDNEELFSTGDAEETLQGLLYKKFVSKDLFKLARGWHTRYFVLDGNRMEYFLTSRSAKPRGVVLLGEDCRVDFQGIPLKRGGREMYCFSIFAENAEVTMDSGQSPFLDGALLLGTPSLEHAESWVNALRRAIHVPTTKNRLTRARTVLEDADEDEEDAGDDDRIVLSPSMPTLGAKEPVHYGDKIRLWTKSAYVDPGSPGDFIGVYLRKKKRFKGTLVAVRPAGKDADFPISISTFTVQDPMNTRGRDVEVCYGDKLVLVDEDGHVWSYCNGYVCPRDRVESEELIIAFRREGGRDGDPVCYRDVGVSIYDCKRKYRVGNYKKVASRLTGGYMYAGPGSKLLIFEIREPGRLRSDSEESSRDMRPSHATFSIYVTPQGKDKRQLRAWNVQLRMWTNPGFIGSNDTVEIEGIMGAEPFVTVCPMLPEGVQVGYQVSQTFHAKTSLSLVWQYDTEDRSMGGNFVESVWSLVPLLAAFLAIRHGVFEDLWLGTDSAMSAILHIIAYICCMASVCHVVARFVASASAFFRHVPSSRPVWKLSIIQTDSQGDYLVDDDDAAATPTMSNRRASAPPSTGADSPVRGVGTVDAIPFQLDAPVKSPRRTLGDTMTYNSEAGNVKSVKDLEMRTWGPIETSQFRLRVGPDYKTNKLKDSSGPAMYNPLGCDLFLAPHKVRTLVHKMLFTPAQQAAMWDAQQKVSGAGAPGEGLPAVIALVKGFPNHRPPNPLWGQAMEDGETHVFFQMYTVADFVVDTLKEGSPHAGIALWKKFVATVKSGDTSDSFLDRFKMIEKVANVEECGFGSITNSLVASYNAKPILTRPQHFFEVGSLSLENGKSVNFIEVFLDVWYWNYVSRQGVYDHLSVGPKFIVDWCGCIEAHDDEEMPEQALFAMRTAKMSFLDPAFKFAEI